MKAWQWVIIVSVIITVVFLIIGIVIPIVFDTTWWWFFGIFIFLIFSWIVIGTIFLIIFLTKKQPVKAKIDLKDAMKREIYDMKYDENNADNFKINGHKRFERIGERGTDPTPILILDGIGTEKKQRRVSVINMNNPKQEVSRLINPTEDAIERAINKIAERPPEEDIKEEITLGTDQFGRPITKTKIQRPSSTEAKLEREQKEVEEKNLM